MRTHSSSALAAYVLVAAALPLSSHAEEAHRELGAHVHGHGTLNIAIEDKRVSMELEVPGMDIVGFEHAPSTDEQKAAVEKAKARLGEALNLFGLTKDAGCAIAEANVELEAEHQDHEDGHGHDHGAHEKEEAGGHSHFHANYTLDCTNPAALTAITFDYFKLFAGAREL